MSMFELVHFSSTINCNTCTVVFNVPKVHERRCLKAYPVDMFEISCFFLQHNHLQHLHSFVQCTKTS